VRTAVVRVAETVGLVVLRDDAPGRFRVRADPLHGAIAALLGLAAHER